MPCLSQRLAARRQTLREKREQERRVAELLQERGQSMAAQVACVDTLLRQDPVRPSCTNQMTQRSESIASQATLGAAEEIAVTEGTAETDDETRRAAWQASVRRLVLMGRMTSHGEEQAISMHDVADKAETETDVFAESETEGGLDPVAVAVEEEKADAVEQARVTFLGTLTSHGAEQADKEEEEVVMAHAESETDDKLDPEAVVEQYVREAEAAELEPEGTGAEEQGSERFRRDGFVLP